MPVLSCYIGIKNLSNIVLSLGIFGYIEHLEPLFSFIYIHKRSMALSTQNTLNFFKRNISVIKCRKQFFLSKFTSKEKIWLYPAWRSIDHLISQSTSNRGFAHQLIHHKKRYCQRSTRCFKSKNHSFIALHKDSCSTNHNSSSQKWTHKSRKTWQIFSVIHLFETLS